MLVLSQRLNQPHEMAIVVNQEKEVGPPTWRWLRDWPTKVIVDELQGLCCRELDLLGECSRRRR